MSTTRAILVAAVVAIGSAATADAGCATVYSGAGCSGSVAGKACTTRAQSTSGSCVRDGSDDSLQLSCASPDSGASWTITGFIGSTTCGGGADYSCSGTGAACGSCTVNGNTASIARVNCAAEACFSGAGTVSMNDGSTKPIGDVRIGDKVLALDADGNTFYDRVFRVTHFRPEDVATFMRITLDSGRVIELSPQHYLHVGSLDETEMASTVRAGDSLFTVDSETHEAAEDTVVSAELVKAAGVYNVHTTSGRLVVSGVSASHMTIDSRWNSERSASMWYNAVSMASRVFGGAHDARAEFDAASGSVSDAVSRSAKAAAKAAEAPVPFTNTKQSIAAAIMSELNTQ